MKYYKDQNNKPWAYDDDADSKYIADGLIPITAEEFAELTKPPVPTPEEQAEIIDGKRQRAYQKESDPLFFKWQRGEGTEQKWLDKVAEIKARYPE